MKKSIVLIMILLISALSFLCIYELFTGSSSFQIDYSELQVIHDNKSREDAIPARESELLILTRINDLYGLPFDLSGDYHREESVERVIETEDGRSFDVFRCPMWKRHNYNANNGITIYFPDSKFCVITFSEENKSLYFSVIYDNGKMVFRDDSFVSSIYSCDFKYPVIEKFDLKQAVANFFSAIVSIFTTSETDTSSNIQKQNDLATPTQTGTNDFLENVIIPWGWDKLAGGVGLIFIFILTLSRTSRLIKKRYKNHLREALFPDEHFWFGNNSPYDIYVSVKIHLKEGFKEYNLLSYFSSVLSEKKSTFSVILGNAGEGKTFSLSRITLGILDKFNFSKKNEKHIYKWIKHLIPIILDFAKISDSKSDNDIITCIYEKICNVAKINRRRFIPTMKNRMLRRITRYLSLGKFVLLLDGYDEIANTETRLSFSTILMNFMNEFNKCNYIITSRTQIYEEERFRSIPLQNTLYLSPLSKEQIQEFLGKWSFSKEKSGTVLYQRIINTVQLESVAANPLLLTMIAHTYSKSDFSFSESRLNLYRQCCECLLMHWEEEKTILKRLMRYKALDNTDLKMELLALFAYYLFENNYPHMKESELLKLWNNYSSDYFPGKSKDVLDDIINQSGLLEKTDNNNIRFRHRSFYEYFAALHMSRLSINPKRLYSNIQNEQNFLFFYLSLTDDEQIATAFIVDNFKYIKLVQDIVIERKIMNTHIICTITNNILESTNFEDVAQLQALGYIAQKYKEAELLIRNTLSDKLANCENEQIKVNIIVGLMIFCEKNYLYDLLIIHLERINLNLLVQYSGDIIDDLAKEIITLLNDNKRKLQFIEWLARTYRFEAIYNIYLHGKKICKQMAIIGILYMSCDPALLDWLESKKFYESGSEKCKNESRSLQDKYGWIENELTDSLRKNLFLLIYLSKELIRENLEVKSELIHNQIAFLISYIISEEDKKVRNELISIPEFEVKSIAEYAYHWNKRKRNKERSVFISNGYVNISALNRVANFSAIALIFLQMIIYLSTSMKINELFKEGWDIRLDFLNDFSLLPFNSFYLFFLLGFFIVHRVIHFLLRKMDYETYSILLTVMVSLSFSCAYELIVQNITFRIISIAIILFISSLEIIKHRNNYPSFKEPQYSKIIEYLS